MKDNVSPRKASHLLFGALCALGLATAASAQTTIYSHVFDGLTTDNLNGSAPDVGPVSALWVSATTANSLVNQAGTKGGTGGTASSSWLPYNTFALDEIYTLTATFDFTYAVGSTTVAGSLGFSTSMSTGNTQSTATNAYGMLGPTRGGGWAFYPGPGNSLPIITGAAGSMFTSDQDNYEVRLVLTTSSTSNWTLAGYLNNTQVDLDPATASMSYSFLSNPSFAGVGSGSNVASYNIETFSFTQGAAVPEPSTYAALMGVAALAGVAVRRRRQS